MISIQEFFNIIFSYIRTSIDVLLGELDFSVFLTWQIFIDILLITFIVFIVLQFIIRMRAFQLINIALILTIFFLLSQSFNLIGSQVILKGVLIVLLIIVPFVYQLELRQAFDRMSHATFFWFNDSDVFTHHKLIKTIKQASSILASKGHGGIIVVEQKSPLYIYAATGIPIHADLSKELILNIFFPKSPLHDGAIIIKNNKIISAGAVLPLTHTPSEYIYGTRHRSAIALSEVTDAIIIVISEERGEISVAEDGIINRNIDEKQLEKYLEGKLVKKK